MASAPVAVPTFFEKARKFVIATVTLVVTVGAPYLGILESSDFTSVDGLIKAVIAVLGAAGVYHYANVSPSEPRR